MTLTQTHHFCVRKVYCLITLICPIILISHIVQLLLIRKFYCFHKGLHISFKYVWHNHLFCPMMGEVSLETKLFFKILQYSQENTCVGDSLIKNIAKFFRLPILKNICKWLLLKMFMKLGKVKNCWWRILTLQKSSIFQHQ